MTASFTSLPADLPVPTDDGAADHLPGAIIPHLVMDVTDGTRIDLADAARGRWVLFVYPKTGAPGQEMPSGWDEIPGARGCTTEACGFRDNLSALHATGVSAVYGLSAQDTHYQSEAVARLHLPYPLVSDTGFLLRDAMGFPVFEAGGMTLYKRMTLVVAGDRIEHVFYPVFPPDTHAAQVVDWLLRHPAAG